MLRPRSAWPQALRERVPGHVRAVLFVEDMARYGLHLHLDVKIEKLSLDPQPRPGFNPVHDESIAEELATHEPDAVWVCSGNHGRKCSGASPPTVIALKCWARRTGGAWCSGYGRKRALMGWVTPRGRCASPGLHECHPPPRAPRRC